MKQKSHTPTPWGIYSVRNSNDENQLISEVEQIPGLGIGAIVTDEDAEFIVRAVNAYDELLEAARGVLSSSDMGHYNMVDNDAMNKLCKAVEKASRGN